MNTEPKCVVESDGTQRWSLNGKWHRTDGPAVIYPDGHQIWYLKGERHRTDGPAVIYADCEQRWYLHDREYDFADWLATLDVDDKTKTLLALKWSTR